MPASSSFLAELGGLDARISDTAVLPVADQAEALVSIFQALDRFDQAAFTSLLIGEVVSLRERLPRPRPAQPTARPATV